MPKPKQPQQKVNFPNKLTVVHKGLLSNKKDRTFGLAYEEDAVVEIDPRQPPREYLDTLIHESLHIIFPNWKEMEVYDLATFMTETLWNNGYRKIYQEDDCTVYDHIPDLETNNVNPDAKMKVDPPAKTTEYSRIKDEYARMFEECEIKNPKAVDKLVSQIVEHEGIYESVKIAPWYWIGCIHMMEGGLNFKTHLHNGDSLRRRTVNVPSGRPPGPPDTIGGYSWEMSAKDALYLKGLEKWTDWSISGMLYQAERYNGWGYRMYKNNYSPYLWSGSQFWTHGKYVSDGKYDPNATSDQIGVAVMLKRMHEHGIF